MPKPERAANAQVSAQVQAIFKKALAVHQEGRLTQAHVLYEQVLQMQPRHSDALHLMGVIAVQTNDPGRAVELIGQAIDINPNNALAYYNRGIALHSLKQLEAAIQSFDQAIALEPGYAAAYNNRGNALGDLKQHEAAIQSFDQAIALEPGYAEAYYNRGVALRELRQHEAALQNYDRAISLMPEDADAYHSRGVVLRDLKRYVSAIQSFDQAIALRPDYAEAHNNRGVALREIMQYEDALQSYGKAIALQPDAADAYSNRGDLLLVLKQHEAAIQSFDQAIALKPDCEFLYGMRLHAKMQICDWRDTGAQFVQLAEKIERNEKASYPFLVLSLLGIPSLQRKAAQIWAEAECPISHALPAISKRPKKNKIRIGYFSADFHDHPVSFLTAELFETHDRPRFELTAFSFGPDKNDGMRKRVAAAFDKFIDVRDKSDKDVATLARSLEIDIAVDLGGFTKGGRAGIFAMRAAPLQVSYLGYLGTMGAECIDYLIADSTLVPHEYQQHYSEKIVYLPSYQANDSRRRIADREFTREELGLPQTGFVFCCFNNNYKITPCTFDGWMRILKQVEGSVLFLYAGNELAPINLRKEASLRGVDAERLIFGKRLSMPDYLARYRMADLFLDTLPYNAGTTASDALWAGLPVLTCAGEAFSSRVAASLLTSICLPELITSTQEEYEALAVDLAIHPEKLRQIRHKLENNRLTTPLFDTQRFTRNIEAAFTAMYDRYQADLPPEHIYINPQP